MTRPLVDDEQILEMEGYLLTPDFLAQEMRYYGEWYYRHPNGGGWVADSAEVDDSLCVPPSVRIGPYTRLLDDKNLCGRSVVQGDVSLGHDVVSGRPLTKISEQINTTSPRLTSL